MVQALVNISDETNRVLNVIKALYGLKDKSQAIDALARDYGSDLLEREFRPEFVASVQKARNGKFRKIKSLDELLS